MFLLNPNLEKDTVFIKTLLLSDLLLMNNKTFPWLILVPRRENIIEIFDLEPTDYQQLWNEILKIAHFTKVYFKADKINIASLGNQVPQLHFHIIARFTTDPAWPNPVWSHPRSPEHTYTQDEVKSFQNDINHYINS